MSYIVRLRGDYSIKICLKRKGNRHYQVYPRLQGLIFQHVLKGMGRALYIYGTDKALAG